MRKLFVAGLAAPLAFFLCLPAHADTALGVACRAYAAAVADSYLASQMQRVDGNETAPQGTLTVHAYGRKYLVPRANPNPGAMARASIGAVTREWGLVFTEERDRCLHQRYLGDLLVNN